MLPGLPSFKPAYESLQMTQPRRKRKVPIAPPWVDSSKGPPRKIGNFLDFSGPRKKWPGMAPNGAGRFFFLLIQTLPTFWAERILILRIFNFRIFWIQNFQISKISRFPENRSLFVGRPFFRKLCASKNDAEPYRRNILGPHFRKHLLFHFRDLWFLNLRSWYQDLGTRILRPRSWYQDLGTKILVPRSWHGTARKYLARHGS